MGGKYSRNWKFTPEFYKHLILSDSDSIQFTLIDYLNKIGIQADVVFNNKINNYDMIWLDIQEPIRKSLKKVQKIRKLGYKGVIIGIIGNTYQKNINMFLDSGVDGFILKPIVYQNFISISHIKKYLK